jgi:hypothetical protein
MTMTTTIPCPATAAQAARARQCPLCPARPGVPCQAKPAGDHLARYLDAYTAGELTRAYMAAVLGELVVITRWRIVPDGAPAGDDEGRDGAPDDGEGCPRCGAVNWGQTPDGRSECVPCGYVDGAR